MFIQIHKLILPDGQVVTGKISAESPLEQYPIEWSGPVNLLPDIGVRTETLIRVSTLNSLFKNWSRITGGKLETESSGTYDIEER